MSLDNEKTETDSPKTIPTAEEEGFTPQEEQELMEKCKRLIEKVEEKTKEEDDSLDILQKP